MKLMTYEMINYNYLATSRSILNLNKKNKPNSKIRTFLKKLTVFKTKKQKININKLCFLLPASSSVRIFLTENHTFLLYHTFLYNVSYIL